MTGLETLKKIEESYREQRGKLTDDPFIHLHERMWFLTIKKELKALEIIKEKNVEVNDVMFYSTFVREGGQYGSPLKCYNLDRTISEQLTQGEFDLLKKVLKQ